MPQLSNTEFLFLLLALRLLWFYGDRPPIPTCPSPTPLAVADDTVIYSQISGEVAGVTLVSVSGNSSTVRITVFVDGSDPLFMSLEPTPAVNTMGSMEGVSAVGIEFDAGTGERDKYGRLLAHVWLREQLFNELLLIGGYAEWNNVGNETRYDGRYESAEIEAANGRVGMWGACL